MGSSGRLGNRCPTPASKLNARCSLSSNQSLSIRNRERSRELSNSTAGQSLLRRLAREVRVRRPAMLAVSVCKSMVRWLTAPCNFFCNNYSYRKVSIRANFDVSSPEPALQQAWIQSLHPVSTRQFSLFRAPSKHTTTGRTAAGRANPYHRGNYDTLQEEADASILHSRHIAC